MKRLFSVKNLRVFQFVCSVLALIFSIYLIVQTEGYGYSGGSLWTAAIWATVVMITISILCALIVQRPREEWLLVLVLDTLASICGLVGFIIMIVGGLEIGYPPYIWICPVVFTICATVAFATTGVRTWTAHRAHLRNIRPSDPLKPYLMKREIDVWCYPVQQENNVVSKQYVTAPEDTERGPSVIQSDEIKSIHQLQAIPPPSVAETTAQWSVPSGIETYRMSQAASTALPSYAGPPSINYTVSLHER